MIDGSGLPPAFGLSDVHASYTTNNHWTTNGSSVPGQFATFSFTTAQSLTNFYLWNHLSTVPPANSTNYYVTQFDLIFRNSSNNIIDSINNLTAVAGGGAVQVYSFAQIDNVSSVTFSIDSNAGEIYTGLAEVRFGLTAIPEPPVAAFTLGLLGLLAGVRRRILRCAPRDIGKLF